MRARPAARLAAARAAARAAGRGRGRSGCSRAAASGARGTAGALPRRGAGGDSGARARRAHRYGAAQVWAQQLGAAGSAWALVAVGGYGRGELHPARTSTSWCWYRRRSIRWAARAGRSAGRLPVGHRPRSRPQRAHGRRMRRRRARRCGRHDDAARSTPHRRRSRAASKPCARRSRRSRSGRYASSSRPSLREQRDRHLKANDTAYNLEPNVKTGPGGLRDIQTIAWVAKRHFGAESLDELATHGFSDPRGTAPAEAGAGFPVEGALRAARHSPGGTRIGCCSIIRSSWRRASATRMPPTRSRSSSSCSATTAPSWT